jgi:N-acetylmuramoyl-L-alanine amidase
LNGWDPTNGCVYYYNPAKTSNAYMHAKPTVTVIGSHRFCM